MEKDNLSTKSNFFTVENIRNMYKNFGIYLVLIVLVIVAGLLNPIFLQVGNIKNVLRQVSINGIISIGMTFVIISGGIDLSVGAVVGATGMTTMILMPKIGMIPAIIVGLLLGCIVGMLNGTSVYKGMPAFIMTLAMQMTVKGFAYVISNGQPYPATNQAYSFIGQGTIGPVPMPIVVFLGLAALAHFILKKTSFGRSVYALGGNTEAARLSGINIARIRVLVFMIAGLMASVASIVLTSRLFSCDPLVGDNYHSDAIAATVIGGTSMSGGEGSVLKTIVGVLIIGIISNILNLMHVSSYAQMIAKGLIIFGAVAIDTWKKR